MLVSEMMTFKIVQSKREQEKHTDRIHNSKVNDFYAMAGIIAR